MFNDLKLSVQYWRIWLLGSIYQVTLSYRRTWLGTLWLSVTVIVVVLLKSFLFAGVFSQSAERLVPSLAMGMAFWRLFSGLIGGGTQSFIKARPLLINQGYPLSVATMSNFSSAIFVFLHSFIPMVIISLFYTVPSLDRIALLVLGLLLVLVSLKGVSFVFAMIGTKYRDFANLISSAMAVLFLVTPVIWLPEMAKGPRKIFLDFNPLYHYLEVLRDPIINQPVEWINWIVVLGFTFVAWFLAVILFYKDKRKVLTFL